MHLAKTIEIFYLFFEGVILFQVFFFAMLYIISRRKEVLYYCLLNLVTAIYFLLNAPDLFFGVKESIVFNSSAYEYANFALFLSINFIYLIFLKEIFDDTLKQKAYVKKIYTLTLYSIPILYLLFAIFTILGWQTNIIFYAGHLVNGPFCSFILILNYKKKGYKSLLIYGLMVVFISVLITVLLNFRKDEELHASLLNQYPLAIIKLGMLIDILLFQLALLKRWNEQEKQLAVEKIESQLAVEKLRNKISAELHDDIGSTLSGVSMYSHLADNQMQEGELLKAKFSLQVIQKSAHEMVDKLNDLVWSVNPGQDSLPLILERIEQYGLQMCKAKNMEFNLKIPVDFISVNLPSEDRYQLFLIIKEAINNAVKYSEASLLLIILEQNKSYLHFTICDNGNGFEPLTTERGNGLNNMKNRAEHLGAQFKIQSSPNKGCLISLKVKITY